MEIQNSEFDKTLNVEMQSNYIKIDSNRHVGHNALPTFSPDASLLAEHLAGLLARELAALTWLGGRRGSASATHR